MCAKRLRQEDAVVVSDPSSGVATALPDENEEWWARVAAADFSALTSVAPAKEPEADPDDEAAFLAALEAAERCRAKPIPKEEPAVVKEPLPPVVPSPFTLRDFGMPAAIAAAYERKGVVRLYDWQRECLSVPGVLEGANLAYSAPTSGGKTLCADVLLAKRVVEMGGKGLFIVPIVTLAEEKTKALRELFAEQKLLVEGYYRSRGAGFLDSDPNGGCDVAVCTIEKAFYLLNRVIEKKSIDKLAIVVLDEAHMIGDAPRGVFVEAILTKIHYLNPRCQIVCLSATMPNPNVFETWLGAKVFATTFRPVPLAEYFVRKRVHISRIERNGQVPAPPRICPEVVRTLPMVPMPKVSTPSSRPSKDKQPQLSHVWQICEEAILARKSVLIFCSSKLGCLDCALEALSRIYEDVKLRTAVALEELAKFVNVRDLAVASLSKTAAGLDANLCRMIQFGVAFHHAGLTDEERKQVEYAFRNGGVRLLFATSTLSIGVNLPASIVIQLSFKMGQAQLDCATYMQMAGRAGRAGHDASGTAYLFLPSQMEEDTASRVLQEGPRRLSSTLVTHAASLSQLIMDAIGRVVVTSKGQLYKYIRSTLAWCSLETETERNGLLARVDEQVRHLREQKYFDIVGEEESAREKGEIVLLPLGIATSVTWMKPMEARAILGEVDNAMSRGFVMRGTLLHYTYLLAPLEFGSHLTLIASRDNRSTETREQKCLRFCKKFEANRIVLCRIFGVEGADAFKELEVALSRVSKQNELVLQRVYAGLIVCDMMLEVELFDVAKKFCVEGKDVEWVMEQASANASQLQSFLELLGPDYHGLAAAFGEFIPRLEQGVSPELVSLMKIPKMNRLRARALFNSGIRMAEDLASAPVDKVIEVLLNCNPYKSRERAISGENVTRHAGFIEQKAARSAIKRAKQHLEDAALSSEEMRKMEISRSQERRKARYDRETKKKSQK